MEKIFYLVDDNGMVKDVLAGEENRQVAINTLEYINSSNENEWIKTRLIELNLEGQIHNGTNTLTTIKLNGIPCRAIVNSYKDLVKIIKEYDELNDDYRKYSFSVEYIN